MWKIPDLLNVLSEARKIDASYEVGEEVTDEVIFASVSCRAWTCTGAFGVQDSGLEKDSLYNKVYR